MVTAMSLRFRYRTGGYPVLTVDGEDLDPETDREVGVVAVHRLAAVGWGLLDSLAEPLDVHHRDGSPAHTAEDNLDALRRADHSTVTRGAQESLSACETVAVAYATCGSCGQGRPQEVREDGSQVCVVCSTVSDVEEAEAVDGRTRA